MTIKCKCSSKCGAVVKTAGKKYARGHSPASHTDYEKKGLAISKAMLAFYLSGGKNSFKGKVHKKETRVRMSASRKSWHKKNKARFEKSMKKRSKNNSWSASVIRNSKLGNKAWTGQHHTEESKEIIAKALRGKQKTEEHIKNMLAGMRVSPNAKEKKLNSILAKAFPGEFKLNVKGKVTIGGKIPDFVNINGKKLVVEHFGRYWHGPELRGRTQLQEEQLRIKAFRKWGFKTVIIWEDELKTPEVVVDRIKKALQHA